MAKKSNTQKKLTGNAGHRPIKDDEVDAPVKIPKCPEGLGNVGIQEWKRVTVLMSNLGFASELDLVLIFSYCQAWEEYIEASKEVTTTGKVLETVKGYRYQNPNFSIMKQAREAAFRYAKELGLTPIARSKIRIKKPKKKSKLQGLL